MFQVNIGVFIINFNIFHIFLCISQSWEKLLFRGVLKVCQTSKMECFVKIVNNWAFKYFRKTSHHPVLDA